MKKKKELREGGGKFVCGHCRLVGAGTQHKAAETDGHQQRTSTTHHRCAI